MKLITSRSSLYRLSLLAAYRRWLLSAYRRCLFSAYRRWLLAADRLRLITAYRRWLLAAYRSWLLSAYRRWLLSADRRRLITAYTRWLLAAYRRWFVNAALGVSLRMSSCEIHHGRSAIKTRFSRSMSGVGLLINNPLLTHIIFVNPLRSAKSPKRQSIIRSSALKLGASSPIRHLSVFGVRSYHFCQWLQYNWTNCFLGFVRVWKWVPCLPRGADKWRKLLTSWATFSFSRSLLSISFLLNLQFPCLHLTSEDVSKHGDQTPDPCFPECLSLDTTIPWSVNKSSIGEFH